MKKKKTGIIIEDELNLIKMMSLSDRINQIVA